jgi:hypothetical protein
MADTPRAVRIDRLSIETAGGSAAQGRELALLVAAELGTAGALPQVGDLPSVRVTVTADAGVDSATLARRIAAATLRALALEP